MAKEKPLAPEPSRGRDGEKELRVRRGRVESVDLYEIKDSELDHFEKGTPGDLELNFAIFLISTATSAICTLASATFSKPIVEFTFLFVAIIGILLGLFLILSWWRTRSSVKALCTRIRERIPADPAPEPAPVSAAVQGDTGEPEIEPDDLAPPVG